LSVRGAIRFGVLSAFLLGALVTGASCYRAEVDLAPFVHDQSPSAGGVGMAGAGEAGSGGAGEAGSGGTTGAPICDMTPEDAVQYQCRLRAPSKQTCDEQDVDGWSGCYNGGCSICTEVLLDYPYYLMRHPCCGPNTTCSVHEPRRCSPLCPPPTELDKVPLCFDLER
jgi:hypothetical protein